MVANRISTIQWLPMGSFSVEEPSQVSHTIPQSRGSVGIFSDSAPYTLRPSYN